MTHIVSEARLGQMRRRPDTSAAIELIGALAAAAMLLVIGSASIWTASDATPASSPRSPASRDEPATTRAIGETFIGAYGGVPYTHASDVKLVRPGQHDLTVKDVAWEGRPFKSPIYYGVRFARWPEGAMFGRMVDFTHSKAIASFAQTAEFQGTLAGAPAPARARIGEVFRHLEFSHGHNMLTFNGLMRLPQITSMLVPYVGLGAGVSIPHTEIALHKEPNQRTYEYQYTGPVGQVLAGLEFRLPRVSLFVEYKFTLAPYEAPLTHREGFLAVTDLWQQLRRWWSGTPPLAGTARTMLASHQIIGGLGFRVGPAAGAAR